MPGLLRCCLPREDNCLSRSRSLEKVSLNCGALNPGGQHLSTRFFSMSMISKCQSPVERLRLFRNSAEVNDDETPDGMKVSQVFFGGSRIPRSCFISSMASNPSSSQLPSARWTVAKIRRHRREHHRPPFPSDRKWSPAPRWHQILATSAVWV